MQHHHVQQLQQLPLVLVQAFDHRVEHRVDVEHDPVALLEHLGQPHLVLALDPEHRRDEVLVVGELVELAQPFQIRDPIGADLVRDQRGELRIGELEESPRSHAVGHVGEAVRVQFGEVRQHPFAQELAVQFCDAVDLAGTHRRQIGHPHRTDRVLLDDRHPSHPPLVAGEGVGHLGQEQRVDPIDDLHVPGQELLDQVDRPDLQRLRQQRVARVGEALAGDVPGLIPRQPVLIHEHPHQLRDGDDGVGVVELEDHALVQPPQVEVARQHVVDEVVDGRGDEEVLLLQPQPLARRGRVLGVEDLGDGLGLGLRPDRALEVPRVEFLEIQVLRGLRLPQAQGVDRTEAIAGDHVVVRHGDDRDLGCPIRPCPHR